jgi:hypothetical protein
MRGRSMLQGQRKSARLKGEAAATKPEAWSVRLVQLIFGERRQRLPGSLGWARDKFRPRHYVNQSKACRAKDPGAT